MKKTRLLEIIREEITGALNEAGLGDQIQALEKQKDAIEKQKAPLIRKLSDIEKRIADLKKKEADMEVKTGSQLEEGQLDEFLDMKDLTPEEKKEFPGLIDSYMKDGHDPNTATLWALKDLENMRNQTQLDEMAYNIVLSDPAELARLKDKIKDSTKKGEQLLYQVIDIIQRDKKEDKPIRQRDIANELGTIQQKINPLVNLLIDYGILTKGESVTGVTKKTVTDKPQGRKPNPNKPEKAPTTGKRGRPAASTSAGKEVTLTPGDDGFDDVSYNEPAKSSDEDKAAAAAAKADKAIGGKYAASLTPEEEDLFKTYKRQAITLANKIEDAESSAEKQRLMGQLKSLRNDPEVARLFKAKGVNV
jgi:hypothetical protein